MNIKDQSDKKKAAEAKLKVREDWHKLVVKIISWSDGLRNGGIISSDNKISKSEWSNYRKHILSVQKTDSLDVVKGRLEETRQSIEENHGFE